LFPVAAIVACMVIGDARVMTGALAAPEALAAGVRCESLHHDVRRGYAITNHARLAEMVGADAESRGEITIGTGGTTFNPATGEWDCIYFMAP
jgi:hypothetical protein